MNKKFKIKSTDIITFLTVFILTSSIFGLYNFKDSEESFELPEYVFEYTIQFRMRKLTQNNT